MIYMLNNPVIYTKLDVEDGIIQTFPIDVEDWRSVCFIFASTFECTIRFYDISDEYRQLLFEEDYQHAGVYEINTINSALIECQIVPIEELIHSKDGEDDDMVYITPMGIRPNTFPYLGDMVPIDVSHKSFGNGELVRNHNPSEINV